MRAALVVLVLLAACGDGSGDSGPPDADVGPPDGVDILFVIDDTASMLEEQAELVNDFSRFINSLAGSETGLPSLHIGVTSTSVDAGSDVAVCASPDNGELQNTPQGACEPPTDRFISDVIDGDQRIANYSGSIGEAFACIAPLGTDGCVFRQPFEAMRRALDGSNPANAGFLRDNALLAVVIISNHDDCSASDPRLFNFDLTELGPLLVYRCFAEGVVCDPDDPSSPGEKTGCKAREDSAYVSSVASYRAFLQQLKPSRDVIVVTAAGPTTPVEVVGSAPWPDGLEPSCVSANGTAVPAIRLAELATTTGVGTTSAICSGVGGALDSLAAHLVDQLR